MKSEYTIQGKLKFVDLGAGHYELNTGDALYQLIDEQPRTSGLTNRFSTLVNQEVVVRGVTDTVATVTMRGIPLFVTEIETA